MSTPKVKQFKVEPPQQGPTRSRQTNGTNNGLNDNNASNSNNASNNSSSNGSKSYGAREKGVIEKMLDSYGFVQCTERRGRFFFHYSEYKGNRNSLKVGDAVEFQESTDKRTNEPVAISIVKLNDLSNDLLNDLSNDMVGGKQFEGVVLTDAKTRGSSSGYYYSLEMGRVKYEHGGKTFFLSFAGEDVENGQRVNVGDKVMFVVANDFGTGSMHARRLRKKSSPCDLHQGVVCSKKDNFGFIERADVVKDIFFHFSEFEGDIDDLALGDDVEYGIQVRDNKDVAVSIHKIAPGSVVFEDVAREVMRGRIKKTLKMTSSKKVNDALIGRIVYQTVTGSIEIVFGEKDPVGDFTMFVGDIVKFSIATDRRDKVQHAINIRLVDDIFSITKEKREKGFITTVLKEGFGFIHCTDRDARMFFNFSELLNVNHKLTSQDEVDFTVVQDPTDATRQVAVRIKVLPRGTIVVQSSSSSLDKFVGTIQKEAGNLRSIQGSKDPDPGILMYEVEGTKQMIPYSSSIVDGNLPKLDEKVEFQISECQKNKTKVAINMRVIGRRNGREKERGFVVTINERFGFIETSDHKKIYFHFSNFEGDIDSLEVGYEVEFQICNKAGKVSAECIRRIPNKSIQHGYEGSRGGSRGGYDREAPQSRGAGGYDREAPQSHGDRRGPSSRGAEGYDRGAPHTRGAERYDREAPQNRGAREYDRGAQQSRGAEGYDRGAPQARGPERYDRGPPHTRGAEGYDRGAQQTRGAEGYDKGAQQSRGGYDKGALGYGRGSVGAYSQGYSGGHSQGSSSGYGRGASGYGRSDSSRDFHQGERGTQGYGTSRQTEQQQWVGQGRVQSDTRHQGNDPPQKRTRLATVREMDDSERLEANEKVENYDKYENFLCVAVIFNSSDTRKVLVVPAGDRVTFPHTSFLVLRPQPKFELLNCRRLDFRGKASEVLTYRDIAWEPPPESGLS